MIQTPTAEELEVHLRAMTDGWMAAMGARFTTVRPDEVVAELTIGPQHLQPLGLVHGGVYSGLVETVASVGAVLFALPKGRVVVGLDNHTSFLHAVREGGLRAVGHPLSNGLQTCVWEVEIFDDRNRVVVKGQVRLLVLEQRERRLGEAKEPG